MSANIQYNCGEDCHIRSSSIFKHLTNEDLDKLNFDKKSESYKRGTVLYHEGSRINGCYCIQKGIIKVYKTGVDGKEQIIRFAKHGDLIGFRSVLSKELACTTAKVLEDAFVCHIPAQTFIELIKNNGTFSLELLQLACRELGEANAYITDIAQKTVRERLAEILIHLKNEFGLDDHKILQISLTREELANIVGTATESVIRLLSEFKHDKLIDLNGRKIAVLNEAALIRIANLYE
ncbi:MAG: Crp/Fnr family transcriptional regulator [Bacteroides sp. SM23_62_1]|nr:MAG: Crp/Fnr family transcriptional regulator [Bacteroides sp. SM23_62_1]